MVKWAEICKPKDQGGLGVISSKRMNIALLSKWLWRIQTDEGGLWLEIIRAKNRWPSLLDLEGPNFGNR